MREAFRASLRDVLQLEELYRHLVVDLHVPGDFTDLLRMQIVYALSAFDRLIHDLIRFYMVETFVGRRTATPKYADWSISLADTSRIRHAEVPPAELVFEEIVRKSLAHRTYLDPEKLSEGLSLVWGESQKWNAIAAKVGRDSKGLREELRNAYKRRNAIVHEADRDPGGTAKLPIDVADAKKVYALVEALGESIFELLK